MCSSDLVAGAYFLSTLMAMPVLLYLLWTTLACRAERRVDPAIAVRFAAAYLLLLFLYVRPVAAILGHAPPAAAGLPAAQDSEAQSNASAPQ